MEPYAHLLQPIKINHFQYRNRVMCSPMVFAAAVIGNEYGNRPYAAAIYQKVENPAKGGCAVVCVGETSVNPEDAKRMPLPDIDFDKTSGEAFEAIAGYAKRIKKHGAVAMIELFHPGSAKPVPQGGTPAWGPDDQFENGIQKVKAYTAGMMEKTKKDFARAAVYMKKAGFDGVVIHAGHGFLFTQFLSSRTNHRKDAYGGSLERRSRFPIEIIRGVRESVGNDFIIELKVSGREKVEGGMEIDEVGRFLQMVEPWIDSVHISSGLYFMKNDSGTGTSMYQPHGYNVPLSRIVKQYIKKPVGVVGGINSPELAEKIIAEGSADYVVLGKEMICDPQFVNKIISGKRDEIRQCVRCYKCFSPLPDPEQGIQDDGIAPWLKVGHCALNPVAGEAVSAEDMMLAKEKRRVLVIGGGIGGMQAALTAREKGHQVWLAERTEKLGGTLKFTDVDTDKTDLRQYRDYMIHMVEKRGVQIMLSTSAAEAAEMKIDPDVVIIATGASFKRPSIPGLEYAIRAIDVYQKDIKPGKRIIMIGGGLVGCETAIYLAKAGCEVTVIDPLKRMANESRGRYRQALVDEMEKCHIKSLVQTKCSGVEEKGVWIRSGEKENFLEADTVVYALGMNPVSTEEIEKIFKNSLCIKAGDCKQVGTVYEAVHDGYKAAMSIK